MKHFTIFASLALLLLAACQPEVRQMKFTDKGPDMTVQSMDASAYMGGKIAFAVDLQDAEFKLSTLKVELLYDESVVNSLTIRTKEYGVYEDAIDVPLYEHIPDGTATLRFTAQNTGLGITTLDQDVAVSRPNFDKLYITVDGKEVALTKDKKNKWLWSVTGSFPASVPSVVRTPVINSRGDVITLGWSGSKINVSDTPIPFKVGAAGVYTISVDLWELTAEPLGRAVIDLSASKKSGVYNLVPDTPLQFPNIPTIGSWELDFDFFHVTNEGVVTFTALPGLYKLDVDMDKKWIKVEAMENEKDLATLTGANNQAIWVIGANFGKPAIGASWNTTDGAYCLAQVAPGVFQLSLIYGSQLGNGFSIKFFHQKGWGGEFKTYSEVKDETGCFKVTSAGNVEASGDKAPEEGLGYRFTIDVSKGVDNATLNIKSVKLVEGLSISVNGVKAKGAGDVYKIALIPLKQGDALTVTGDAGLNGFALDPDFLTPDGKFNAVDGNYAIELHLDADKKNIHWARFWRVDDEGNNVNLLGGGCYFMGGTPAFFHQDSQINWPGTGGLQMAQVKPGVYQVSGYAMPAGDNTVDYARWQTEAMNVKYFYQDGWGGEASDGQLLTDRAAQFLEVNHPLEGQDAGNIYLKEGVTLEQGAFYVMTVDFTGCTIELVGNDPKITSGKELIDFYKK